MKILSKLNNTGMIEEVANKRYVTDAEKSTWNSKTDKTYVDSQDALKADKTYVDSKVQTDVPSGAKFTDTVYIHPETHPASMITDLPTGKKVARFVVGTSTAGWTAADCDYLCDGTADQAEINAAITALPATGGEVVILDGTYNITAPINVTKDNASIRGNGNSTILKRMYNEDGAQGVITLTGRSGCKIANLQIDGNGATHTSTMNYTIYLSDSSNNTVTGNTCNNSNWGIYLMDSSNNTVTGNNCNNIMISGICLSSSNNNAVTGNISNNNGAGIELTGSSSNTVTGNTFNNSEYGIYFDSSSHNIVIGNTSNNNGFGIYLDYLGNNNTVTGNTCNDNNVSGIFLNFSSNNTVTGNTCIRGTGLSMDYTMSQHTIQLGGTNNSYNLISNNNCMGKAVTNEGGTGNSVYGNKYDSGDYKDFTQDEKTKLAGIAANANNYTHPTTAGNKHIPAGGASGQILRYSASGTAIWGADNDTITTINGKTGAISKADIVALGIPSQNTNTTYSEITTAEIDTGTASTLRTITGRRVKYILDKVQGWISGLTKSDVGLSNVDNVKQATKVEFDEHKEDLEKHITESERINWNSKGVEDLGTFNDEMELFTHILQLPTGHYTCIVGGDPTFMFLRELPDRYSGTLYFNEGVVFYFELSLSGEILDVKEVWLTNLMTYVDNQVALKVDKTYVDSQDSKLMPISGGVLENYREKLVILRGTSTTIDLSFGNVFTHSLTGNTTYSITNAVLGQAHSFTLIINQTATARTLTFPASVKWQGGEIPDMSTPNKTYILTFMTIDGGTNWLGMFGGSSDVNFQVYASATDDDFSVTSNRNFQYIGSDLRVVIPNRIKGVAVTTYIGMFNTANGKLVEGVASNNTNVTNMYGMFRNSTAIKLDLSNFDTSNVTDMTDMFRDSHATELDLSGFDTSNVTNMNSMFSGSKATTLDLSSFDTSNVTIMVGMFYNTRATTLDLSSFDTSKVTNTDNMFQYASATTGYARTQADADKFNASSNKPARLIFTLPPPPLAQDNDFVKVSGRWVYRGSELEIEIPHTIQGEKVTAYNNMFYGTGSYLATPVTRVVSNNKMITAMFGMFQASSATTLDLSSFDTSNVTTMTNMFNSSSATTLDLSSFDTSKVTTMSFMFYNSKATALDLSSFDTSNVTTMNNMFDSSKAITLDLSSFDTSKVAAMNSMFSDSSATTLDLSNFDTSNVTNMTSMFYASSATTLDLSSFDTSSVTNMSFMFNGSKAITLDLSSFDTSSVTNMNSMFRDSSATTGYARTQADADRFNASSNKPTRLTFIVKP